jgi:ABC-type molybdate transport system permease subunit
MEVELLMLFATAAVAVVPWAFSIHAKVAVIASAVEGLPDVVEELRHVLKEHEDRLNEHAKEIASLKETPRASS